MISQQSETIITYNMFINERQKLAQLNRVYMEQLAKSLHELSLPKRPQYQLSGSGCRQKSVLMSLPVFRVAVCTGLLTHSYGIPYGLMITASHNPADDNGIKIGYAGGRILDQGILGEIGECINNDESYQKYIKKGLQSLKNNQNKQNHIKVCFVGRDCRTSSPKLSKIVVQMLQLLGIKVIDVGICTTPELYSLSKYIIEQKGVNLQQLDLEAMKDKYVKEVVGYFEIAWKMLHKQENIQKIKILLDFSNGSGAISFLKYRQLLSPYFQITQTSNTDFSHPNFKCGAAYYYKNWHFVIQSSCFSGYNTCSFFDGDSDRIIVKVQDTSIIFDGNYFVVLYVRLLKEIVGKLEGDGIVGKGEMIVDAVGSVVTNFGVKLELERLGVPMVKSRVGTTNLYAHAIKSKGFSVFFQPNGHGGIYFSDHANTLLHSLLQKHPTNPQLTLLHSIGQILKNNSRGYGLHNMLVYYLSQKYLHLNKQEITQLFTSAYYEESSMHIGVEYEHLFGNGVGERSQLVRPEEFCDAVKRLVEENGGLEIFVRKSETEKCLIRINVQGMDAKKCQDIRAEIQGLMVKLGYVKE